MSEKWWKWLQGVKEIASSFPCCPMNPDCSWKKTQIENSVKVTSVIMVPTSLGHYTLRSPFPTTHMINSIVTMADNNTFSFNMCNFGIISDFKKKTQNFSNSVKQNTLSKFEFIALNVVSATLLLVFFWSLNKSTCQTRKNIFHFTSKALFVLEKIKS